MLPKGRFVIIWILFWTITAILFSKGYNAQLIDDLVSGILYFEDKGWGGFADSYGFPSLYYGHNITFYGFYSLFGRSAIAWYLLFTGLHSLNATFAYGTLKRIFSNNKIPMGSSVAAVATLVFLVSPYQVENVIWAATLHYAVSTLLFWLMVWLYASHLQNGGLWKLLLIYLLFALALLTLEIALVFPGIMVVMFGFVWRPTTGLGNLPKHLLKLALPMALIIIAYLFATFALKGHFIGHYGSDVHGRISIVDLLATFWQQLVKLLSFSHYLEYTDRAFIYDHLKQAPFAIGLFILVVLCLILLYKQSKTRSWFMASWLTIIFIALLPVLNMYFMYLNQGETDRLSYLASIFIFAIPPLLLAQYARKLFWPYAILVIGLSISLLQVQTHKWQRSAAIHRSTADSPLFYEDTGKIYLLNLPCYYQGVYIYRIFSRHHRYRKYLNLPDISDRIQYVSTHNMFTDDNAVSVTKTDQGNTYKVELTGNGTWFWSTMDNEPDDPDSPTLKVDEWNHSYTISIPKLDATDKLIYFNGNKWVEAEH